MEKRDKEYYMTMLKRAGEIIYRTTDNLDWGERALQGIIFQQLIEDDSHGRLEPWTPKTTNEIYYEKNPDEEE